MTKINKTWQAVVLMVSINLIVVLAFVIGLACKYGTRTPYVAGARAIEYDNLYKVMEDDVAYLPTEFFDENKLKLADIYSGYEFNGKKNLTETPKRLGTVKLNFDINKVLASQSFDKRIKNIESYEYTLTSDEYPSISIKVQGIVGKDKKAKYEHTYGSFDYSKSVKQKSVTYETQLRQKKNYSRLIFTVVSNNGNLPDETYAQEIFQKALENICFCEVVSCS